MSDDAELRALRQALVVERGINADLREELARLRADLDAAADLCWRQGEQIAKLVGELEGRR